MQQDQNVETGDDGRGRRQENHEPAPLRCPRCHSTDTKFRYYNNNDRGQPRHYCKTCRRYWTEGGSMRNIPFGGNRRTSYDKPAKDSSSSSSHGSLPAAPIPPAASYDPNDEISCLAAIQSLTAQPAHVVNQLSFDIGGMNILQDRTFQSDYMAALNQTAFPQAQLPGYGGDYPNWPMMNPTLPQDFNNNFNFSAANAGFWSNSGGNTDDPETARTSMMNSNDWPHFPPNYGGPPP